jgi:hypothetical protein
MLRLVRSSLTERKIAMYKKFARNAPHPVSGNFCNVTLPSAQVPSIHFSFRNIFFGGTRSGVFRALPEKLLDWKGLGKFLVSLHILKSLRSYQPLVPTKSSVDQVYLISPFLGISHPLLNIAHGR